MQEVRLGAWVLPGLDGNVWKRVGVPVPNSQHAAAPWCPHVKGGEVATRAILQPCDATHCPGGPHGREFEPRCSRGELGSPSLTQGGDVSLGPLSTKSPLCWLGAAVPFAEQDCCFSRWGTLCCPPQSTEPLIMVQEQEFSKCP